MLVAASMCGRAGAAVSYSASQAETTAVSAASDGAAGHDNDTGVAGNSLTARPGLLDTARRGATTKHAPRDSLLGAWHRETVA